LKSKTWKLTEGVADSLEKEEREIEECFCLEICRFNK